MSCHILGQSLLLQGQCNWYACVQEFNMSVRQIVSKMMARDDRLPVHATLFWGKTVCTSLATSDESTPPEKATTFRPEVAGTPSELTRTKARSSNCAMELRGWAIIQMSAMCCFPVEWMIVVHCPIWMNNGCFIVQFESMIVASLSHLNEC